MKTTIAELKTLTSGTEVGGFALLIKTARRAFTEGVNAWQEVVFMDVTGEMLGHVLLATKKEHDLRTGGYTPWQSKTNLCIMKATLQTTDDRGKDSLKLVVTDCFDTVTPLSWDQRDELTAADWQRLHDEETAGKIRHGLTIACIGAFKRLTINDAEKAAINSLVEFIKHG